MPLLYQHVLDASQGNMTLSVMKDSKARCMQTNTELQITDLSDNIQTPQLTLLALKACKKEKQTNQERDQENIIDQKIPNVSLKAERLPSH